MVESPVRRLHLWNKVASYHVRLHTSGSRKFSHLLKDSELILVITKTPQVARLVKRSTSKDSCSATALRPAAWWAAYTRKAARAREGAIANKKEGK
jgi:hypothetical protein